MLPFSFSLIFFVPEDGNTMPPQGGAAMRRGQRGFWEGVFEKASRRQIDAPLRRVRSPFACARLLGRVLGIVTSQSRGFAKGVSQKVSPCFVLPMKRKRTEENGKKEENRKKKRKRTEKIKKKRKEEENGKQNGREQKKMDKKTEKKEKRKNNGRKRKKGQKSEANRSGDPSRQRHPNRQNPCPPVSMMPQISQISFRPNGNKYISNCRGFVDVYVVVLNSNSLTKRLFRVCVVVSVASQVPAKSARYVHLS